MNRRKLHVSPVLLLTAPLLLGLFATEAVAQTATVKGKVTFEGTPPKPKKINMDAEKPCAEHHKEPVFAEKTVVGPGNEVQWAFIHVAKGIEGKKFETPTTAVQLIQEGCQYKPHVFGVMVGQGIDIVNADPVLHNVHAMPETNAPFNLGQPGKGMKVTKKFDVAEKSIKIKCDVHPWMNAHCFALEHPFFAVSAADGTYEIKNLPPGEYGISIWHEKWKSKGKLVTVAASETKQVDFVLKAETEGAAETPDAATPGK